MTRKRALLLWLIALGWGWASLLLYRSTSGHGPDMVADEVFAFMLPIVISLGIAIGLLFTQGPLPEPFQSRKYAPLLISIVIGAGAVAIYSALIVR
ncbi:MAG: hypothetical protein WD648_14200 [Planctomycetaceae bacterium]